VKKTCVIGWPIAHSRSPLIHGYWIKQLGLDADYRKVPIKPENLPAFFREFTENGFAGCNVTIPHKEAAFQLVSECDAVAGRLGAVNTVYVRGGRLHGSNTDGEGFLNSLKAAHPDSLFASVNAVIIGAGGSARAVIGALLDEGVPCVGVINRTSSRIDELIQLFGPRVSNADDALVSSCGLIVNATSQGMEGQPSLNFDITRLKPDCMVADLVYTPLKTDFLLRAEARGHRILPGLGMLLHQAVRGFELWHGVRPEVTQELYELVTADVMRVAKT
jgi:shikimate dehydrogenase